MGRDLVEKGHLVASESCKLKEGKLRYLAYEKEMLVMVHYLQL